MHPEEAALAPDSTTPRESATEASPEQLLQEGKLALSCEEYPQAIAIFDQALDAAERAKAPATLQATINRYRARALSQAGSHRRSRAAARAAIEQYRSVSDLIGEAKAMTEEANACLQLGDYPAGLAAARESLRILRPTNEHDDLGILQMYLGSLLLQQGDWNVALEHIYDALSCFRRTGNEWGESRAYGHLAVAYKNLGRLEQSIECSERAEETAGKLGRGHPGFALNQGIARYWIGDHAGAQNCFHRSLGLSRRHGDRLRHVRGLLGLGRVCRDRGDLEEADRHLQRAEILAKDKGYRRELVLVNEYRGNVALDRRDYEEAKRRYNQARMMAERVAPGGDLTTSILVQESEVARRLGQRKEALEMGDLAVTSARQLGRPPDLALALMARGYAAHDSGQRESALSDMEEGLQILRAGGIRFELARALCGVAKLRLAEGRPGSSQEDAVRYIQEAVDIFRSLGEPEYLARAMFEIIDLHLWVGETDRAREQLQSLRKDLASQDTRIPDALSDRLAETEQKLIESMTERAVSANNPFHALQQTGTLPRILALESEPENELLRVFLDTLQGDRGLIALLSHSGDAPVRVVSHRDMPLEEAQEIARCLWRLRQERGDGTHGISLTPSSDPRFAGSPLHERRDVGACLWLRIERENAESALVYADRRQRDLFQSFGQMDLNLAVSLSQILAVSLTNLEMRRALDDPARRLGFVTRNDRMVAILGEIQRLSGATTRVLLEGETGTGKGLLAQVIHKASGRGKGPFIPVNCNALPENLVESEIFGHKKGSFTHAVSDRRGLAAQANGGTLFIDEIDKTTTAFQQRFLHLVDTGEYRPVGRDQAERMNALIVCAANSDLRRGVEEGRFLKDLYYRLKVIQYRIPPLRERREDIPLLVQHFLRRYDDGKERRFTPEAFEILLHYDWPGNVRSLENEIERVVLLSDPHAPIGPEHFSEELRKWAGVRGNRGPLEDFVVHPNGASLSDAVTDLETRMVSDALRRAGWNKSRAAKVLGLTRRGLDNKIARYGIVRER